MKKKKKKLKISFDRIFLFLVPLFLIGLAIHYVFNLKIKNIYIHDNTFLKDQYIIEKAGLENYPSSLSNMSSKVAERLKNDLYISDVKVTKKGLTTIHITVKENRPLFYYQSTNQTILQDGTSIDTIYNTPTVLNYITDSYYEEFVKKMGELDKNILARISEIRFMPNDVDDNRFLLSMSDGNYVYINMLTFDKLNKYLTILESLPKEKGILYLDYGNNFEILK